MNKPRTVLEAIERAEQAYPRREGQSITETYRMMERRYKYMVDEIGEIPTLNDED